MKKLNYDKILKNANVYYRAAKAEKGQGLDGEWNIQSDQVKSLLAAILDDLNPVLEEIYQTKQNVVKKPTARN